MVKDWFSVPQGASTCDELRTHRHDSKPSLRMLCSTPYYFPSHAPVDSGNQLGRDSYSPVSTLHDDLLSGGVHIQCWETISQAHPDDPHLLDAFGRQVLQCGFSAKYMCHAILKSSEGPAVMSNVKVNRVGCSCQWRALSSKCCCIREVETASACEIPL